LKLDAKKALVYIALAFLALSVWNNPGGTASSFSSFLGDVGSWIEDAIDKGTEFFRGLFE
jgi:cell shape-determining protein MreC